VGERLDAADPGEQEVQIEEGIALGSGPADAALAVDEDRRVELHLLEVVVGLEAPGVAVAAVREESHRQAAERVRPREFLGRGAADGEHVHVLASELVAALLDGEEMLHAVRTTRIATGPSPCPRGVRGWP